MTESDEIADSMAIAMPRRLLPETFADALAIVRRAMPDETAQVQDNVAESLLRRGKHK